MRRALAAVLALALPAASAMAQAGGAEEHYYPRPTEAAGAAHPWLVLLPGGGGIDVFGDGEFYFDVAREWNEAGFDVLVVHYQPAAPLVEGAEGAGLAGMQARVAADALAAARRNGWLDLQCPGFAIGFSSGGAGTLALAADPPANLAGAIGFYPLVAGQPEGYRPAVPVLVLQGDLDELTTRPALDAFLAKAGARERFTVVTYPEGPHGFDIPSLATPVEYNGGTFAYHAPSAEASKREVAAFRRSVLAAAGGPAECNITQED